MSEKPARPDNDDYERDLLYQLFRERGFHRWTKGCSAFLKGTPNYRKASRYGYLMLHYALIIKQRKEPDWVTRAVGLKNTSTVAMKTWQPIETAPKNGTKVLVLWRGRPVIASAKGITGFRECTHWMPRPSVPEVE